MWDEELYKKSIKGETMKIWDAVLHKEWIKGDNEDAIIHFWAEDNSRVVFKVPPQLRDQIVEMQNWLAAKQQKIDSLERELARARGFFEG